MTRPDYIARGGDLVMAQPLALRGATMYSFLVPAELGALTRMIDAQLNAVTGASGTIYKPLLPMAAIVCAGVEQSYSTTPPDSQKGWMGERDFGVWIPVIAGTMERGVWRPARIAWYLPYVFVDNVAAMVTGREIFGFFKQTAALAMPANPRAPGRFSIDALVIRSFAPTSQAETLRLLTLTSTTTEAAPDGAWRSHAEAAEAVWEQIRQGFFAGARDLPITGWDLLKNLVDGLATGDVPLVFLKQFRAIDDPTKACYQAVVEAPAHLDRFYAGWFTHPHDVTITPCDSHPIVAECGLAGPALRAELGFWCRMDFTMRAGTVIAEAT